MKKAIARRVSGMLYDVTYPGHADLDSAVPWRYLEGLRRKSYTVEVHNHDQRGEGEPAVETFPPEAN